MLKFDNPDRMAEFGDAVGIHVTSSMLIDGEEFMQKLGL